MRVFNWTYRDSSGNLYTMDEKYLYKKQFDTKKPAGYNILRIRKESATAKQVLSEINLI